MRRVFGAYLSLSKRALIEGTNHDFKRALIEGTNHDLEKAMLRFIITGLCLTLFATSAHAEDAQSLAVKLAKLRSQVEELTGKIDNRKMQLRARVQQLASQEAELKAELERVALRKTELATKKEKVIAEQSKAKDSLKSLEPVVSAAIASLRASIAASLPFKVQERLSAINAIADNVKSKTYGPATAFPRLWGFVEDELRLAKESGLHKQVITLGGEEVIADIARIGTVMLYFQTPDGRYGYAEKNGDSWRYKVIETSGEAGREKAKQLAILFDSLRKGIRSGFFKLPNGMGVQK